MPTSNNAYIDRDPIMVHYVVDETHWSKTIAKDETPFNVTLTPEFIERYNQVFRDYWNMQEELRKLYV